MTGLLLGPLLRHVGYTDATVWVETDRPCVVEVLGFRERTWSVAGHHYALVVVEGLAPGTDTAYQVRLDGELRWPVRASGQPPSRIRTLAPGQELRVAFGSCRYASMSAASPGGRYGVDALAAYATSLAEQPQSSWPHALLMLGDQVYADTTSPRTQDRIRRRRDVTTGAREQVADFEEYSWLYAESWADEDVRWLLSTIPTSMIFDDHDVRDDWNISRAWRAAMRETDWWQERIIGALSSYWVYQHLGNLSPAELADNDLYQRVRGCDGDAEPLLREFARAADHEADGAKGARWSYRRDLGPARLLVIDSRCGRILEDDRRSMVSEPEFAWIEAQLAGEYDHLLIGTSLPWLLPRAFHDLEAWNELLCDGHRGRLVAGASERLRQRADLEHWAAFRMSFERLVRMIGAVGRGSHAGESSRPPATVSVLSGDVHHCYVARAQYGDDVVSSVHQLTCSPVHNSVAAPMKLAFRGAWSRLAERWTSVVLGLFGPVPAPGVEWERVAGPYFGNQLMTLHLEGPRAEVVLEKADSVEGRAQLTEVARHSLSSG